MLIIINKIGTNQTKHNQYIMTTSATNSSESQMWQKKIPVILISSRDTMQFITRCNTSARAPSRRGGHWWRWSDGSRAQSGRWGRAGVPGRGLRLGCEGADDFDLGLIYCFCLLSFRWMFRSMDGSNGGVWHEKTNRSDMHTQTPSHTSKSVCFTNVSSSLNSCVRNLARNRTSIYFHSIYGREC